MDIDVIVYVLVIDFLAIMSPGPDFFMVLKNSLTDSLKAGFYTTLGIALGSTIVFACGLFGIGTIVASSKYLFMVIKFAGAFYLAYLAIKSIFSKVQIREPQMVYSDKPTIASFEYFKIGLICNITNPKAFMFIISLSTYVANHGNPYIDGTFIILGSAFGTLFWFTAVSFLFGRATIRNIFYKKQRFINIIFGLILLYVASRIVIL
ncbi:MAG: LysE family transporter [Proteobacteria bacterium]|jgi:threonine/homoserine/homoserine lactone efflux protein|nr:LysE family transporter [Pseudomonadota bacterium]